MSRRQLLLQTARAAAWLTVADAAAYWGTSFNEARIRKQDLLARAQVHNPAVRRAADGSILEIQPALRLPHADVYTWFGFHNAGLEAREEIGEMPVPTDILRFLVEHNKHFIYLPEMVLQYSYEADAPWYADPYSVSQKIYQRLYQRMLAQCQFLDAEGRQYLAQREAPILLTDVIVPVSAMQVVADLSIIKKHHFTSLALALLANIPAGMAFVKGRKWLSIGLAALGVTGSSYLGQEVVRENETRGEARFDDIFRTAAMAVKILKASEILHARWGQRPAFLLTTGSDHAHILESLTRGERYNYFLAEKYTTAHPRLARAMGRFYRHAYLFDLGLDPQFVSLLEY